MQWTVGGRSQSELTVFSSQTVIGEESLVTEMPWTIGQRLAVLKLSPSERLPESPRSVGIQQQKSARSASQCVIGEINLGLQSFTL